MKFGGDGSWYMRGVERLKVETRQGHSAKRCGGRVIQYWVEGKGTTMAEETVTQVRNFPKVNSREVVQSLQGGELN